MATDYSTVTEFPGTPASREQMARMYHRYRAALPFCEGKDVLEVGCGAGLGLGYLAQKARRVVGGDYTQASLQRARQTYQGRVDLVRLDAHQLPFAAQTFDVVLLLEAIYYLASAERFIQECVRILRKNGLLMICSVNKDWQDFNPSPFSVKYFSAPELADTLSRHNFAVELYGAFPVLSESLKERGISALKRAAVATHLIPTTMKGKRFLKRIFFGRLSAIPEVVVDGSTDYAPWIPISSDHIPTQYKIFYAVARAR